MSAKTEVLITINLPDNADWYEFTVQLFKLGTARWRALHIPSELLADEKNVVFPDWRNYKDLHATFVKLAQTYWASIGLRRRKRGRPSLWLQCLRGYAAQCAKEHRRGRFKHRKKDGVPLFKGRPITLAMTQHFVRKGCPGLSLQVTRKYGRILYLTMKSMLMPADPLTESEYAFLCKNLPPPSEPVKEFPGI